MWTIQYADLCIDTVNTHKMAFCDRGGQQMLAKVLEKSRRLGISEVLQKGRLAD